MQCLAALYLTDDIDIFAFKEPSYVLFSMAFERPVDFKEVYFGMTLLGV